MINIDYCCLFLVNCPKGFRKPFKGEVMPFQGRQLCQNQICHPSENESTLKGKNLLRKVESIFQCACPDT